VKRISHMMLVLPLILAAAPLHSRPLPVPPIPPANRPTDGPAPTPNPYAAAPFVPETDGPKFTPRLLRAPTFHNGFDPSQGYVSGSRWQDDPMEDRRLMPSPGFNFQIPFK